MEQSDIRVLLTTTDRACSIPDFAIARPEGRSRPSIAREDGRKRPLGTGYGTRVNAL